MNELTFRPCRASDHDALARIYRDAIRAAGSKHYSPAQVVAWSSFGDDPVAFGAWLEQADTLVALDGAGTRVGFAGINAAGHIESLFVAPAAMRQGVASQLLSRLLQQAREAGMTTLTTAASELSRPVFAKLGFNVIEIERTEFKGVAFSRYIMNARLVG